MLFGAIRLEKGLDFKPQFFVALASIAQKGTPLAGVALQDRMVYLLDLPPSFGPHDF
jgi:hypothetical protein